MSKKPTDHGLGAPSQAASALDDLPQMDRIERKLDEILILLRNAQRR